MLNFLNKILVSVGSFGNSFYESGVIITGEAMEQVDFITDLYKLSPIIGLLLIAIGYLVVMNNKKDKALKEREAELMNQLKEKDDQLKELNQYVRQSEKENLLTLQKVSSTLDRVIDSQKSGDNIVLKEIDNLKDIILLKLKKDNE
jgi:hypothetical protein